MKKVLILVSISLLVISCGSLPSEKGEGSESAKESLVDVVEEKDETKSAIDIADTIDEAVYSGDEGESGEIADSGTKINSESEKANEDDAIAAEGEAAEGENDVGEEYVKEDNGQEIEEDNAVAEDDGDKEEDRALTVERSIIEEVPNVEFDDSGRGVIVSSERDDWDAPIESGEEETYRVAQQPKMSEEEEELFLTRYDETFSEPDVALVVPPPLAPLPSKKTQRPNVQGNKTNKGKPAVKSVKASFAMQKTLTSKEGSENTVSSAADKKEDMKDDTDREDTVPSSEEVKDPSPVNARIASAAVKSGDNALNLPILPKEAAPSDKKSEVFVTEYRPEEDNVEEDSGEEDIEENKKPSPSRSITIKNNQYLDAVYPGAGWVYLGEKKEEGEGGGKKVVFKGRKLGETETQFTLRAQRAGKALLHFYKNDVLTNNYIDDYLEVIVLEDAALVTEPHAIAPSYAEIVPPRPVKRSAIASSNKTDIENKGEEKDRSAIALKAEERKAPVKQEGKPKEVSAAKIKPVEEKKSDSVPRIDESKAESGAGGKTVVKNANDNPLATAMEESRDVQPNAFTFDNKEKPSETSSVSLGMQSAESASVNGALPEDMDIYKKSADDVLSAAQKAYNGKRYADCLKLLSVFFDKATKRIDEGLYLEGLSLESHSNAQNIKGAIDTYDILMKNWPASKLWNKARERSIYLKRMYIDIR